MTIDAVNADLLPTRAEAERLDKRIRLLVGSISDNLTKLYGLVEEAKQGQIHAVLGFPSWTAYVSDAFQIESALPRDRRRELVAYLSGEGMSQRAIADMVNVAADTVNRDLAGVRNRTPATPTTGLDGKTYQRKPEPAEVNDEAAHDPTLTETVVEGELTEDELDDIFETFDIGLDEFEQVMDDARAEGDLSRENVERLAQIVYEKQDQVSAIWELTDHLSNAVYEAKTITTLDVLTPKDVSRFLSEVDLFQAQWDRLRVEIDRVRRELSL